MVQASDDLLDLGIREAIAIEAQAVEAIAEEDIRLAIAVIVNPGS